MSDKNPNPENVILYWQVKIFRMILRAIMVLGFIAYVPSVSVCIVYKIWSVALLDTFVVAAVVALYYSNKIPFSTRVFLLNSILYVLGVGLLLYLGPSGAGWIWLFAFPILGTVLSGFRSFMIAMLINFFTLSVLGFLLYRGALNSFLINQYSIDSWSIVSINFLCVNLLFCYPIGILVKEMKSALDKEIVTQQLLLREREALARKNTDLTRTNNDLDNFIYTASHDLKAPISNIEGLINQLSMVLKNKNTEVNFLLDMVFKSSERLNNTIKDLTEISKTHHNIEGALMDEINIVVLIEDIIKDLKAERLSTNFNLTVPEIKFSRKNLRSIIYNLISNAIKYASPDRGLVIHIRSGISDGYFLLELEDNGLGMAEGYEEKIFKMFKRMHDHVEGSGLGLYILNRIVENNGGKIEVESKVNQGSTFKIYLNVEA